MPRAPLFLARQGYRRRRLADLARVLPVLGLALFLLPILDARDGLGAGLLVYLFVVWAGLIVATGIVARHLDAAEGADEGTGPPPGEGP